MKLVWPIRAIATYWFKFPPFYPTQHSCQEAIGKFFEIFHPHPRTQKGRERAITNGEKPRARRGGEKIGTGNLATSQIPRVFAASLGARPTFCRRATSAEFDTPVMLVARPRQVIAAPRCPHQMRSHASRLAHCGRRACSRTCWIVGEGTASISPMVAIATSNSINDRPPERAYRVVPALMFPPCIVAAARAAARSIRETSPTTRRRPHRRAIRPPQIPVTPVGLPDDAPSRASSPATAG